MPKQVMTTCRGIKAAPEASQSTLLVETNAGAFAVDEFVPGAPLPEPGDQVVIEYIPGQPRTVLGAGRVDKQVDGVPTSVTLFSGNLQLAA
jgi:hypothetical protein